MRVIIDQINVSRLAGWSQVLDLDCVFSSPVSCVQGLLSLPAVLNFRTIGNVLPILAGKTGSTTEVVKIIGSL